MARAALVLAALALAGCVSAPEPAPKPAPGAEAPPKCRIAQVVDGDTVVVACAGKPTILGRLTGVDAPEIKAATCPAERVKGQAARAYMQRLVEDAPVTGVRYGARIPDSPRQLVTVELGGRDLGAAMVAAGQARAVSGDERPDWCAGG